MGKPMENPILSNFLKDFFLGKDLKIIEIKSPIIHQSSIEMGWNGDVASKQSTVPIQCNRDMNQQE